MNTIISLFIASSSHNECIEIILVSFSLGRRFEALCLCRSFEGEILKLCESEDG